MRVCLALQCCATNVLQYGFLIQGYATSKLLLNQCNHTSVNIFFFGVFSDYFGWRCRRHENMAPKKKISIPSYSILRLTHANKKRTPHTHTHTHAPDINCRDCISRWCISLCVKADCLLLLRANRAANKFDNVYISSIPYEILVV